jgi:hypothetical protein
MKTYSLYDSATGVFTGQTLTLPEAMLKANVPPGLAAMEGAFNEHGQRVDLETGEVVEWQSPQPPGDDMRHPVWDENTRRWRFVPTERAEQLRSVRELEGGQARALRALALNPDDQVARQRLVAIEAAIAASGVRGQGPSQ